MMGTHSRVRLSLRLTGCPFMELLASLSFACLVLRSLVLAWRAFMDNARIMPMSRLTEMWSSRVVWCHGDSGIVVVVFVRVVGDQQLHC